MSGGSFQPEELHSSFLSDSEDSSDYEDNSEDNEYSTLLPPETTENWDLDRVLIGGAKPEQAAAVPTEDSSCMETIETVAWIFSPMLFLVIGIYFVSVAVSTSKLHCSWGLWMYYLMVGLSFLWTSLTSCVFVVVYKLKEKSGPLLSIPYSKVEQLLFENEHVAKEGFMDYSAFRVMVDQLVQVNNARRSTADQVPASVIIAQFRVFDQYKGGFIPIKEIRATIKSMSRFNCVHLMMQFCVVGAVSLLLAALVYGSMYSFSHHKHTCAAALTLNMEESLFCLWMLFGTMLIGTCIYFYKLYGTPTKNERSEAPLAFPCSSQTTV